MDTTMGLRSATRPRRAVTTVAGLLAGLLTLAVPTSALAYNGFFSWLPRDTAAPEITQSSPPRNTPTADPLQTVTYSVSDPIQFGRLLTFLDQDSLMLAVDGMDRRIETTFEPAGLARWIPWFPARRGTITFSPTTPLSEGEHTLIVRMADGAGNVGTSESTLLVDTLPPEVAAADPAAGATIADITMLITLEVSDAGAGVDWSTLAIDVNGGDPQVSIDEEEGVVMLTPSDEWSEGELTVTVSVADVLDNETQVTLSYVVMPDVDLAVGVRAVPSAGPAPLTVTFSPEITTDTAIESYSWDFNGDGSFDRTEPIGREQRFTYQDPGTYQATLRVIDSRNEQVSATATIQVGNAPPQVNATAEPSNGAPPLAVTFSTAAADRDGIASYEWDFEGDGTFDRTTETGATAYTYATEGTFQPRIRVTDFRGAATTVAVPSVAVRVTEGAPSVTATASPTSGEVPLTVSFNATASDPDGLAITQWAWDFDRDGANDFTSPTSAAATFDYMAPGTYYPRVTVTAEDGGTSSDVIKVKVEAFFALSLSTDTIDTELGETVAVETTLGGDTRVSVVIERPSGEVVATLVPWQLRQAGRYSDAWSGLADDGALVSEGEYRAVLLYEIDGVERRLDLGGTDGREYNPNRNRLPNTFAPFAGDPLEITFSLPEASEVTAFVGRFDVNTRLVTFYQRDALGRGSHTIVWNGTDAEGRLIQPPPGDEFLFGIFAFSLPDNAVYVRSGVHVTDLEASPPIYTPTEKSGNARSRLTFELNRSGGVELAIYNADSGGLVDRLYFGGLDAGENTIEWDGRNGEGVFVAPGKYRLGVAGVDARGGRTPMLYTVQRIYY